MGLLANLTGAEPLYKPGWNHLSHIINGLIAAIFRHRFVTGSHLQ